MDALPPRTLAEKIIASHLVVGDDDVQTLYVDLHLVHEVSSPQAFDGLRAAGLPVRRPDLTIATEDHNVPTIAIERPIPDPVSRTQIETLRTNCREFGIRLHSLGDIDQGIVHVVGPQLGLTQPGLTIACGDSHTSTHGAFGALAFGIGTSEVEHVLATQTITLPRFRSLAVTVEGSLPAGSSAKDLALAIIARLGSTGGQGAIIEYRGSGIDALSMEGRMTLCNMTAETGARAGIIAPDAKTLDFVAGRPHAPQGVDWDRAVAHWRTLHTDEGALFDQEITIDASGVSPFVTWGTNPGQGAPVTGVVPHPDDLPTPEETAAARRALDYMELSPGTPLRDIAVDVVFIGSCTNSRLEDLRDAAALMRGRTAAPGVRVMVVPGSTRVRMEAEAEGLADVFRAFGAEWRHAGCSMCLGMNSDQLAPGQRCASTSNRNFEGRQGAGVRTHLVSPAVAAATAVLGRLASPADLPPRPAEHSASQQTSAP